MDIDADSAGVRVPPPLAYLGTLLAGLAIDRFSFWHMGIPLPHWIERTVWGLALAGGFAIMLTAVGLFKKANTEARPWKTSTALVTDGVYRWTRNPMYLGMALIYLGFAVCADSLVSLLLLVPLIFWITRNVIEREEAYMTAKFGDEYRAYRERVGRWF